MKKLLFIAFLVLIVFGIMRYLDKGQGGGTVLIEKGKSISEISKSLKEQGVIKSEWLFKGLALIKGVSGKIQAGEYKLPENINVASLLGMLSTGKGAQNEKEIKVIEGWTLDNIAIALKNQGIDANEFFALTGRPTTSTKRGTPALSLWAKEFSFLEDKPAGASLEGFLFPDTYRVYKDASAEDVVQKMLSNFDKKLSNEMRDAIKNSGHSFYDIMRVASIVEAEVPDVTDRPIVAGIIWKRLEQKMALQVDSTLNYITSNKSRALSADELAIDSPYNTYKYRGLPPTPIGNPGLEAIKAAITPKESSYLYWLSDKNGKTIFSGTLDEHNTNKAKYLK